MNTVRVEDVIHGTHRRGAVHRLSRSRLRFTAWEERRFIPIVFVAVTIVCNSYSNEHRQKYKEQTKSLLMQ